MSVRSVPDMETGAVLSLFVIRFFFVALLVAITFIDLDLRIIPHELTIAGIVGGLAASPLIGAHTGVGFQESAIGALVGGGIIFLVIHVYFLVRRREGMGGGDFMMMAMLGAWLGYEAVLFVLFAASLQGTLAAVVLFATGHRGAPEPLEPGEGAAPGVAPLEPAEGADPVDVDQAPGFRSMEIPFGPFLALAALEWAFFEPWIREALVAWLEI
jgi:leader peptidase (prepilin peptidase)/N-methyltransferase